MQFRHLDYNDDYPVLKKFYHAFAVVKYFLHGMHMRGEWGSISSSRGQFDESDHDVHNRDYYIILLSLY